MSSLQAVPDLTPFLGVPFVAHGRTRTGCDCWGLARLVYADLLAVRLPAFDTISPLDTSACGAEIAANLPEWVEVVAGKPVAEMSRHERFGDVVLMREGGVPAHVGIAVPRGRVLHVTVGSVSRVERLDSPMWRTKVVGYYRHRSLA